MKNIPNSQSSNLPNEINNSYNANYQNPHKIQSKLFLLIIVICFTMPLVLFNGIIDPFAPMQSLQIIKISYTGYFSNEVFSYVPFFYIFGSIISIVTGMEPNNIVFFPVQLFVGVLAILVFCQKMTSNRFVVGLIALVYISADTTGNKFFFWPHGMGLAIIFLIAYLYVRMLNGEKIKESFFLLSILILSLMYYSYDLMLWFLLITCGFIASLSYNFLIAHYTSLKNKADIVKNLTRFIGIFIFSLILLLGVSTFFFVTFFPRSQNLPDSSFAMDKFLKSYFMAPAGSLPYSNDIISYPSVITYISLVKYGLIFLIISVFLIISFSKRRQNLIIDAKEMILISFLFMATTYFFARLLFGVLSIPMFFIPSVITIAYLYDTVRPQKEIFFKYGLITVLFIILSLNCIYYTSYVSNNLIDKNDSHFEYMQPISDWLNEFTEKDYLFLSDKMTQNVLNMNGYRYNLNQGKTPEVNEFMFYNYQAIDPSTDFLYIINKQPGVDSYNNKYYIVNNRMNILYLNEWVVLKPWRNYKNELNNNQDLGKIFNSKDLEVLH